MTKEVEMVRYTAAETGFYEGHRIRKGSTFTAPADLKASWALTDKQVAEQGGSVIANPIAALLARPPKEVIALIGEQLKTKDDFKKAIDAEVSGQKRKAVLAKLNDAYSNAKTAEVDTTAGAKVEDDLLS